jgi:hypothetical protein
MHTKKTESLFQKYEFHLLKYKCTSSQNAEGRNSEDPDPVRMQSKKQASINFVPNWVQARKAELNVKITITRNGHSLY